MLLMMTMNGYVNISLLIGMVIGQTYITIKYKEKNCL